MADININIPYLIKADTFTTVDAQQAYTRANLNGKTVVMIVIGEAVVPFGDYGLAGTTLTFANFTVQGTLKCVVFYI